MTNKDKFRETFGVELCYCGLHGKEGCFYIAGYDKYNDPYVITTTKHSAKDWLSAEYKPTQREENNMNEFYKSLQMPKEFMDAVETIMKYCQNEDCHEDCKNCPNPLSVIRCGDEQGASDDVGTSVADAIRNMDNNTLAIYLHSWQAENMSVEQIKETLRLPLVKM